MGPSDKTNAPKFRGWVLRAALSGIVLALVFSFPPLSDVLATARRVDAGLWLASLLSIIAILALAALAAATGIRLHPVILRRLKQGNRLHNAAEKISAGIGAVLSEPRALLLCLALCMAVQAAFIGMNIAFARAAGWEVPIAAWFFAWPLSKIIASLPLSLVGLGVPPLGAAPASDVATGLLWQTILFATGLIGGTIVVLSGTGSPTPAIPRRSPDE